MEVLLRVLVGGAVVCFFSFLGDFFKPKNFAGLFGAAPSVALATLALTIKTQGHAYAAAEARAMIFGAIAFLVYALTLSWVLMRRNVRALRAGAWLLLLWFAVALSLGLIG